MASIRVAIAQLNFRLGDFESNVAAIVNAYQQSVQQDADLVVFSELAVCGYPPEDLLLKQRFIEEARAAVEGMRDPVYKTTRERYGGQYSFVYRHCSV